MFCVRFTSWSRYYRTLWDRACGLQYPHTAYFAFLARLDPCAPPATRRTWTRTCPRATPAFLLFYREIIKVSAQCAKLPTCLLTACAARAGAHSRARPSTGGGNQPPARGPALPRHRPRVTPLRDPDPAPRLYCLQCVSCSLSSSRCGQPRQRTPRHGRVMVASRLRHTSCSCGCVTRSCGCVTRHVVASRGMWLRHATPHTRVAHGPRVLHARFT